MPSEPMADHGRCFHSLGSLVKGSFPPAWLIWKMLKTCGSPFSFFASYYGYIKVKVFSLSFSPPCPPPTLHSLVTPQLCEEDCFSNISVKVSYQLQTPEGRRDHPHPVLDLYTEPSAIFQVILPTPVSRPSWEPSLESTCSPNFKEC